MMRRERGRSRATRGAALIVAMLVLAMIGLVSTAILRDAIGSDRSVADGRRLAQAREFAELALRLCERQPTLPAATQAIAPLPPADPPAWTRRDLWLDGPALRAHVLGPDDESSPERPRIAPRCLVEATALPKVYTATARGFSPDFAADPANGATRAGAVVWLQSTVLVADDGSRLVQRVWQQLMTPPF